MGQIKTGAVGLRQRGFIGRQEVHGFVEIEEGAGGLPEPQQERQQQDEAGGEIAVGSESIYEAMSPVRWFGTFAHGRAEFRELATTMIPGRASNAGAGVPLVLKGH